MLQFAQQGGSLTEVLLLLGQELVVDWQKNHPAEGKQSKLLTPLMLGVEIWHSQQDFVLRVWWDLNGQVVQGALLREVGRWAEGKHCLLLLEENEEGMVHSLLEDVVMWVKVGSGIWVEGGRVVKQVLVPLAVGRSGVGEQNLLAEPDVLQILH